MIVKVKDERWVLGRRQQQVSEEDEQDAAVRGSSRSGNRVVCDSQPSI